VAAAEEEEEEEEAEEEEEEEECSSSTFVSAPWRCPFRTSEPQRADKRGKRCALHKALGTANLT
jgi:hypothetical protein